MNGYAHTGLQTGLLLLGVLLSSGCSPSIHDLVARGRLEEAASMLRANPSLAHALDRKLKTPLHKAVTYKQIKAMELLLSYGADINSRDITGMTPLHVAAMLGRRTEAEWLLKHGADPTVRDDFGDTALHTAAVFGNGQIIALLVAAGVSIDVPNGEGDNAHTLALRYRQERVARYVEHLSKQP